MRQQLQLAITFTAIVILAIPLACSSKSASVRPQPNRGEFTFSKDPEGLRAEVLALIPIGSDLTAGQKALEARGFRCTPSESDSGPEIQKLVGRLERRFTFMVTDTWIIAIEAKEKHVSNVEANHWATGP